MKGWQWSSNPKLWGGGVGGKGNSGRGGNRKCEGVCIRYILYALFK